MHLTDFLHRLSFSAEAGHYSLALACIAAFLQCITGLWGAGRSDARLMRFTSLLATAQLVALLLAFLALIFSAVTDDFSVRNIVENSARDKPLLYKITGVWGNHEGSILLWALILAFCGMSVIAFGRHLPRRLKSRVIAILGGVSTGFLLFCVTTSNPFDRVNTTPPLDGFGKNPLLQDPGLAFHPPVLYAGYVGFAVPFAFAVAALLGGRVDAAWGRWVRPWALGAWCFLTCGIAMGSWWSYYVLGWGGYWFWDPVENASLIPWLAGTALVHSAIVVEKREALKVWTILLAIATFSFSLSGTFLVRSGILNSVHAFANDPARGVFILLLLALVIGTALALFAWRAPNLVDEGHFMPVSREGALILNNILLCTICAIVLVGTMYPPFMQILTGRTLSVGKPFFDATTIPLMLPLMAVMVTGPLLSWKRGWLRPIFRRLRWTFVPLILSAVLASCVITGLLPTICAIFAVWLILGSLTDIGSRVALGTSWPGRWQRLRHLPLSSWGTALAHIGVAITVLGITGMSQSQQKITEMAEGAHVAFNGYEWTLGNIHQRKEKNFDALIADVVVTRHGHVVTVLHPARHVFARQRQMVTDVAIHTNMLQDLYCVLGDARREKDGQMHFILRLHVNPLAPWIWLGGLVMATGGALSLCDRRRRLGAPRRRLNGDAAVTI